MKKSLIGLVLAVSVSISVLPVKVSALSEGVKRTEQFQSSVYAQRLDSLQLRENWREDIAAVALAMVGYHEGNSKDDYDGKNSRGWKNFTEFGQVYNGLDAQWCAMFISWCARQAQIPKYVINTAARAATDGAGGSSKYLFHIPFYKKTTYTPAPGDIVFFTSDGYNTTHVGIAVSVSESGIWTVEGNCLNAVRLNYYDLNSDYIKGYGVYAMYTGAENADFDSSSVEFICADGVMGSNPDGDPYDFSQLYALHGAEFTIPEEAFVRNGYSLAGYCAADADSGLWYIGAGSWGAGEPEIIEDASTWNFSGSWTGHKNIQLYCVWADSAGNIFYDSAMQAELGKSIEAYPSSSEEEESGREICIPVFGEGTISVTDENRPKRLGGILEVLAGIMDAHGENVSG